MNYPLYYNIPTTANELYHFVMNPTTLQVAPKGYKPAFSMVNTHPMEWLKIFNYYNS